MPHKHWIMSQDLSGLSDHELLAAVLERRAGAWETFYRRFHRLMASCIRKVYARYGVVHAPEDMEDLLGNVCFNLVKNDYRKLRLYDPEKGYKLSSWVGLISANTAHDELRRREPEHLSIDGDAEYVQIPAPPTDPLAGIEREEQRMILERAMWGLSHADRNFFHLYYNLRLEPDEIAARLCINVNTVYSRKNKIRDKLIQLVRKIMRRNEIKRGMKKS